MENMRIGGELPFLYIQPPPPPAAAGPLASGRPLSVAPPPDASGGQGFTGIVVEISPQGRAAYEESIGRNITQAIEDQRCGTCESRRYQDRSDDASVSFQSPTHISPGQSFFMVAAHEAEHVMNERMNAERDGREVVSQTVRLSTAVCPECQTVYVSGGETRTVTRDSAEPQYVDIEA
ncbi:MAG: hypothetical protein FWG66_00880 [Spirochaetes bacterium]|nr:hypothetical protein [Spirochaetota bacterium]